MPLALQSLSETVSTYSQLNENDLPVLAQAGFKTIICNRPDGEGMGQADFKRLKQAAVAHGIEMIYVPFDGRAGLSLPLIEQMQQALETANGPVLAYCKSGMRSALLWCFALAPKLGVEAVIDTARSVGFELSHFAPMIEQHCAQNPK